MPFALESLTKGLAILGQIIPATLNNTSANVTDIDIAKVRRLMAIVSVGAVTGGGSLVGKLQASKTAGGSYTDITGGALTAITAGSKIATIEVRDDELESIVGAGYRYVKLVLTEGGSQNVVCGAVVLGGEAEYKPAGAYDIAAAIQRLVI